MAMNRIMAQTALTNLVGDLPVGAIILDDKGEERSQCTGHLGTDSRFPDKWLVSAHNQYITFKAEEVHEVKDRRIFLRLLDQRNPAIG